MSHDLYTYGEQDPIFFKLTLSGLGVAGLVPGTTILTGDIQLSQDGGGFANIPHAEIAEVGLGWYKWTPSATAQTQCEVMIINIADAAGGLFDENGLVIATGGNASARFSG